MSRTAAERARNYVGYNECEAMRHLLKTGRSIGEIAFMLERDERTVRKHVRGDCKHP